MEINYLDLLNSFNIQKFELDDIYEVLNVSKEYLNKLLELKSIDIYFFDEETFLPELKYSSNELDSINSEEILNQTMEEGIIGEVLEKSKPMLSQEVKLCLILPLLNTKGALGFIILLLENEHTFDNQELILNILAGQIACKIETIQLTNKAESVNVMMDQLVAERTRAVTESKEVINQKIEQLKNSLLMTIPHEVRTPLNQILGFCDYLLKAYDDLEKEEAIEIIEDILESGQRLRRLFENYLYLTSLTMTSHNIAELEKLEKAITISAESSIVETIMAVANETNNEDNYVHNISDSPIKISESHFRKLVREIFDNALKFNGEGKKVEVNSNIINDKYQIEFIDYGSGMPADKIHMLDAYIQFDRMKNEQQGLGLGLSIAKKILNIYNGSMEVESKKDEFTKVKIILDTVNEDDI